MHAIRSPAAMGVHEGVSPTRWGTLRKKKQKEREADALALGAEERRGKLRKAVGRCKQPAIHGYLNGATRLEGLQSSIGKSIAYGGEPGELKHLSSRRKRKKNRFRK